MHTGEILTCKCIIAFGAELNPTGETESDEGEEEETEDEENEAADSDKRARGWYTPLWSNLQPS